MTDKMKKPAPLAPELQQLIDEARFEDGPDAQTQARLFHRLAGTLALPLLPTAAAGSGALAAKTAASFAGVKFISLIAAISAGISLTGIAGWYIYRHPPGPETADTGVPASTRIRPPAEVHPRTNGAVENEEPTAVAPEDLADAGKTDVFEHPRDSETRSPQKRLSDKETMAAERVLIEAAREALRNGFADDSLVMLRQHKTRFARGRLAEERDALQIMALAKIGKDKEAQKLADRFMSRYPKSMFVDAVHAALKGGM